ncbi:MAG: HEPN domain-containing protein [Oscillospiraceae bacterium]|nr:HEPN domain-containing protein [Oscillospiraceae bacterium]
MSRKSSHSGDSKRYYDWLFHAYQDLLAARMLITDKRLFNPTVFHCQQAIEKSLKAFLLYKHRKLFDGHNLTWLCKQAALTDQSFTKWIGKSTLLNRFYIETRYPADIPEEIDRQLVEEILEATEDMMDFICDNIKFDYNSYHYRSKKNK